jgi:hypothetical protein
MLISKRRWATLCLRLDVQHSHNKRPVQHTDSYHGKPSRALGRWGAGVLLVPFGHARVQIC